MTIKMTGYLTTAYIGGGLILSDVMMDGNVEAFGMLGMGITAGAMIGDARREILESRRAKEQSQLETRRADLQLALTWAPKEEWGFSVEDRMWMREQLTWATLGVEAAEKVEEKVEEPTGRFPLMETPAQTKARRQESCGKGPGHRWRFGRCRKCKMRMSVWENQCEREQAAAIQAQAIRRGKEAALRESGAALKSKSMTHVRFVSDHGSHAWECQVCKESCSVGMATAHSWQEHDLPPVFERIGSEPVVVKPTIAFNAGDRDGVWWCNDCGAVMKGEHTFEHAEVTHRGATPKYLLTTRNGMPVQPPVDPALLKKEEEAWWADEQEELHRQQCDLDICPHPAHKCKCCGGRNCDACGDRCDGDHLPPILTFTRTKTYLSGTNYEIVQCSECGEYVHDAARHVAKYHTGRSFLIAGMRDPFMGGSEA